MTAIRPSGLFSLPHNQSVNFYCENKSAISWCEYDQPPLLKYWHPLFIAAWEKQGETRNWQEQGTGCECSFLLSKQLTFLTNSLIETKQHRIQWANIKDLMNKTNLILGWLSGLHVYLLYLFTYIPIYMLAVLQDCYRNCVFAQFNSFELNY